MKKLLVLLLLAFTCSIGFSAPYLMTQSADCGPACLHAVTDVDESVIIKAMGWNPHAPDITDNPQSHFYCLKKLNIPYRIVTCGQILVQQTNPAKTVVLLHGATTFPNDYLRQHWITVESVHPENQTIRLNWGDGSVKQFSFADFTAMYANGGPTATAYEVGTDGTKPSGIGSAIGIAIGNLLRKIFGK